MKLYNAFDNPLKAIDRAMTISKSFVKKKRTYEAGSMVGSDNRCVMQRLLKKVKGLNQA